MTQDLYYYETGYIDESYFVYTADAESIESSTFTMTAAVGVIKSTSVSLSSEFTVPTAILSNVSGSEMFAFTDAALSAEVTAIKDNNISVTSAFTQVTAGARIRYVGSDQYFDAAVSLDNSRVRNNEAASSAAFSLAIDFEIIVEASADLTNTFTQTVEISRIRQFDSSLSSEFTQTATISHIEGADLTAFANASLSTDISITKQFVSNVSSTSTVTFIGYITNKRPRNLIQTGSLITTSTTQKLIGTHSLYIPDSATGSDYLRTNATSDFTIPSSTDFIIEFYFDPSQFSVGNFIRIVDNSDNEQLGIGRYNIADNITQPALRAQWVDVNNQSQALSHTTALTAIQNGTADWVYAQLSRTGTTLSLSFRTRNNSTLVWSSASTVTRTYNNQIGYSQTNLRLKFGQDGGTFGGYIDEFYIAKGTGTSQQFISGAPERNTLGNDPTTLALYHFDGDYVDDINGISRATAALSTVASLTADVRKFGTVTYTADLTSTVTFSATATADKTLSSDLTSQGFVVAAIGRIRPEVADLTSTFSLSADISAIRVTSSDLSAEFTQSTVITKNIGAITSDLSSIASLSAQAVMTVDAQVDITAFGSLLAVNGRIRPEVADLTSTFSLLVDTQVVLTNSAAMNSEFTQSTVITKNIGAITSDLSSIASLTAEATAIPSGSVAMISQASLAVQTDRLRNNVVQGQVTATLAANAIKVIVAISNPTAQANLTLEALRVKQLTSNFTSVASELVAVVKTGQALIDIQTVSTLIANATALPTGNVQMQSQANLDLAYKRIRNVNIAVTSAFQPVINVTTSNDARAVISAVSTMNVNAVKTSRIVKAVQVTATLTANAKKVTDVISLEFTLGTMTVSADRIRGTSSQNQANTTLTVLAGRRLQTSVTMNVQGFVLAVGELLYIDPDLIYVVPKETRSFKIRKENRLLVIDKEDREYIVRGK